MSTLNLLSLARRTTRSLAAYWTAGLGVYSDAGTTPAADTDPVQQWDSRVGNLTLSQDTLASRPVLDAAGIGGQPALVFDGVDDYLEGASGQNIAKSISGLVIVSVFRRTGGITDRARIAGIMYGGGDVVSATLELDSAGRFQVSGRRLITDSQQQEASSETADLDTDYIFVGIIDYAAATVKARVNGAELFSRSWQTAGTSDDSNDRVVIGGRATAGGLSLDGSIAAAIFYPSALTTAEILTVEQRLAVRYGITLA